MTLKTAEKFKTETSGGQEAPEAGTTLISRREFAVSLGALAAAAICGCFFYSDIAQAADQANTGVVKPRLKPGLRWGRGNDLTVIEHGHGRAGAKCAVNDCGARILKMLTGAHSVEEIANATAQFYGIPQSPNMAASIAGFIAQLGMLGFLAEPFYAVLYDTVVS